MKGLSIEPSRAFGRRAAFFRSIRRDIFTHINAGNAETRGVVEMARALIIPGDAQFNLADPLAFQRMLKSRHRLSTQALSLKRRINIKIADKGGAHFFVRLVPEIADPLFCAVTVIE